MNRSKWIACLLAFLLCFGMLPSAALAETENTNANMLQMANNAFDFVEGEALDELEAAASQFPSSFDLRHVPTADGGEVSYVTPVKVQNPFGTCWGFAAISAAESSLLSSGLAAADGLDAETLDLAEKPLGYFASSYIANPTDPQYGEGVHFRYVAPEDAENNAYRYNTGGMTLMATSMLASGTGPVLEKYPDPETGELKETRFAYKGANGEVSYWVAATEYDDEGQPVPGSYHLEPVWYSDQDDWTVPESYRFAQNYRLRESIVLPAPAGYTEEWEYEYQPEAVDAIRQQISQYHRAVSISFCAESYLPGQDTSGKQYMSENWAHFTNVSDTSTHSITIVGYDDNYPKENFASTTENGGNAQPEGNGAFLCKNSWGSELNDFPNNGLRHWGLLDGLDGVPYDPDAKAKPGNKATGYFWISYYDRSLNDPEAFVFDRVSDTDYSFVEQMDYMYSMSYIDKYSENEIRMANVFTAEATSRLNCISFMTTTPGTTVSYAIYLLGEGYADPADGLLIETGECSFAYGGYHRIDLSSPRVLTKWQQYSVVIRETVENEYYACCPVAFNHPTENMYYVGVINPGESYFYNDGAWADLSESATKDAVTEESAYAADWGYETVIDNFPIKSYLDPISWPDGETASTFDAYLTVNNWQESNPGTFTLAVGESKTLTAEFRGSSENGPATWDPSFEWVSGDSEVMSVSTSTPKKGQAVITGLKPGVTRLIVYAGDRGYDRTHPYPDNYGVRVLTINVYEAPEYQEDGSVQFAIPEEEAAAGTAVLPMMVYSTDALENAQEIHVTVPKGYPCIELEIPAYHVTTGDIVYLVEPDGTEVILPDTAMTEDGVRVKLYGDSVLKPVYIRSEFEDVAYDVNSAVEFAFARGLMRGVDETHFAPEETLSRAMAVTVLYRMMRSPEVSATAPFADVAGDSWYADAIAWCTLSGVAEGYGSTFGVDDPVTREQLVAMLWRLNGKPAAAKVLTGASAWAATAMSWAVEVGLIKSDPGGYHAAEPLTRAETAEIIMRYINNL